jgi:alpha-L-fucosidase 2
LFRIFLDALPLAKVRTPLYFGHEGAFFPETMSFWGTYENGDYGWGWRTTGKPGDPTVNEYIRFHYSGTLEMLAMMIDYYEHTGDKDFLKKELLPIADEYLLWWDQHWSRNEKGKLKMYPSYACESFWNCTNPTPDVAGLIWDLDRLLALTDKEIGPDRRVRWMMFRKAIPPIPMTEIAGRLAIAAAQGKLPERTNSENPELYAVFPFRIYGVGKPEPEVAIHTFENRGVKSNAGWRQDETQAAYLGLAKTAAEFIAGRAKSKHGASRFPAFWGPNFDWTPDQDHGGNLLMGLQTMILQADDGKIRLLPAWPKNWDLDFKLHAPHRTVIEGSVRNGTLVDMKVTPESRKKDVIVMETQ